MESLIMVNFLEIYEKQTGTHLGSEAQRLTPLFQKIVAGELLPPRGQQAVDCGFTAHALNDPNVNPPIYKYYQWVLGTIAANTPIHELPAKIIGDEFICANIFQTNWPQPLTVNHWQVEDVLKLPLTTRRAVIIENNGVFIWLHHLQPTWPIILQSGNDFNPVYKEVVAMLARQIEFTYLGDLDTQGIKMADTLTALIKQTGGDYSHLADIQNPGQAASWVAGYGISMNANQRIHADATIGDATWQQEANFLEISRKFVEQEQLIREYERAVPRWLAGFHYEN
jgi:hypothetical protein